jgi:kinesin family protein 2/24
MMGTPDGRIPGLYLLAARDIIEKLNQFDQLYMTVSFYEIYG